MRVARFSYELPPELVAQEPPAEREDARLMVGVHAPVVHAHIRDLASHVAPGTLLVVNDTKVIRARILGVKEGSGGKAEIFLVKRASSPEGEERWRAMARTSKPLREGARVLAGPLVVTVEGRTDDGPFTVCLASREPALSVAAAIQEAGQIPLPPYIKRTPTAEDEARYQTIFARAEGAIAAPTAGLHLTRSLVAQLEAKGCELAACTLHVGLGTFEPVKTEDLDDHPMHTESFEVSTDLVRAIARARERGAAVMAVGTTAVRALESAADPDRVGYVRACAEETRILIQPGYTFRVVDQLLTNFHLPRSTLLALGSAFAGTDEILDAYRLAVRERYRFFSYGDAMLLARTETS